MSSQGTVGKALPILQGPAEQKDPVCGMTVVPEKAADSVEHAGKTYYFCSKGCAKRFSREPDKFLAASETAGIDSGHTPAKHAATQHTASAASREAAER